MKTFEKIENNRITKKINSYVNKKIDKKYNTFEEIFKDILIDSEEIKGFGLLTSYIIASDIAVKLNINKTKIFLFHKKISRAIKILNIKNIYKIKINNKTLQYVNLEDIINNFENINILYDKNIINKDSDLYTIEKYLYYWQSRI